MESKVMANRFEYFLVNGVEQITYFAKSPANNEEGQKAAFHDLKRRQSPKNKGKGKHKAKF